MRFRFIFIILLGLGINQGLVAQKKPSVEDETYRAEISANTGYPDYGVRIAVSQKERGLTREVQFRSLFSSVSELKLRGDHLIVVGQLPSEAGTNITIVDLEQGKIQDTIWTWTYAFSPSGRYLAFTTFVARNEPAYSRRALVLVHDLDLDASHNRLPAAGQPSYENAGIPVFPPVNLLQGSYDIFLEPQHNYISGFLWSSDESRLVFIDWIDHERFINLVNLEEGPKKAKLQRKLLDIMAYADYSKIPDYRRRELEEKPTRFTISSIEWESPAEDKIRIELQAEEWLPENLVLELPDDNELGD